VSRICVPPPSDSDAVVCAPRSCDRSKSSLTGLGIKAFHPGWSGWRGKSIILVTCCLFLMLAVSGCGTSADVLAASGSSTTASGSSSATTASSSISFVQKASSTPQSPTATVSVGFPAAQTSGDLNVVVVGWNDTSATVLSVKDSAGNPYKLAIGPTSGTALRQSIYYAANIAGSSNTVTVSFNQAAAYPDVRVLEYRGVTALDATSGASGNGTSASSGSATTTNANELIVGADMVYTQTGSPGSGFTSRIITVPDGDIAEDKIVTATGSYSSTATLSSSGPWVMQMATFSTVPSSTAPVTNAQLTPSATSLNFGNIAVGSTSTQSVTLTSSGTTAVTLNSASISGTGFTVSGATFPVTLSPKQTVTLAVKYAPTVAGSSAGTLNISSNASSSPTISLSGTAGSTPSLTVSPTSLSFGDVTVGSSASLGVILKAGGAGSVTVRSAAISGTGFSMSGASFPVTLTPNQSVTLQVKFAPTAAKTVTGTLAISSNLLTNPNVSVGMSGTGTQHQVSLSWSAPSSSSDPVAGYHIYRATGTSSSYARLNSAISTQTSYLDSTVAGGTSYLYYVKSVDASGNESSPSNSVSVTIP
jgi:Abnormal spindle-like microcephaly-assoc'd, ASPM-SPD-2-Hydin/Domain of unknown function (DUF4402)